MRKPKFIMAFDEHRDCEVSGLRFFVESGRGLEEHESSKLNESYTHVSKKSLACLVGRLAKNHCQLDRFLIDNNVDNNNL